MPHLLNLTDLGREGLITLVKSAERFRARRQQSLGDSPIAGKTVALVFEKASTRTRVSLEIAVAELGGHPVVIDGSKSQMARGEPIRDTARVLSRMVHAITFRTGATTRLEEMAHYSSVPVLNALTDDGHPMQLLADLMTVRQVHGSLDGLRYAWVGDGNNMANSWIEAAGLLGLTLSLACPAGYAPDAAVVDRAAALGANLNITADPREAVEGADVVSTDVFTSMGQEAEQDARRKAFSGMMVSRTLLQLANPGHIVLHCLPAHRDEEIEAEVLEGPRSFVWDQAEARLHTAKSALLWAMGLDG